MTSHGSRGFHVRAKRRGFGRDENGFVTIEFILWLPLFVVLWAVTTDACLLFLTNAAMWNVARDTARRASVEGMTETAAHDYADSELPFDNGYNVQTKYYTDTKDWRVRITAPFNRVTVFGILDGVSDQYLVADYRMRAEP